MLFDLFVPGIIPHVGRNSDTGYSSVTDIVSPASEIPRSEYNYVWNSDGIRSIEFGSKPRIVALGCSITLGQGIPQQFRWTDLLSKRIGEPIGNISYSGSAINKNVSSFFGMINKYNYLPEYVLCNFANFERFYFIDGSNKYMRDWYANYKSKKTKVYAPFDYEEILPYEWVYYNNLDHIKMLEAFCRVNKIKLIWTTWSNGLTTEQENFIMQNFEYYYPNSVKGLFPTDFEFGVKAGHKDELTDIFRMKNWDKVKCHSEYYEACKEVFDHGYDYHSNKGSWGQGAIWPHPGLHYHLHWSDYFYNAMKEIS